MAVAVGLRSGASGSIVGIEESSLRALAKVEQVLPSRLRHRLNALQSFTLAVPTAANGPRVAADVLTALVAACRDRERLRFDYRSHSGSASRREAEPYRLVNWGRRWYLVAWDIERADWRTYRVDRIQPRTPTGPRFTPRPLPDEDLARYVSRGVGAATWRYRARVIVHAPAEVVAERLPISVGPVAAIDEHSCELQTGSDSAEMVAVWLGMLGADFEVPDSDELREQFRILAERYARAAGRS